MYVLLLYYVVLFLNINHFYFSYEEINDEHF